MTLRGRFLAVLLGLAGALFIAAAVSPFASSAPDGLEKIAYTFGFIDKGERPPAWQWSLFPDYGSGGISTGIAGFFGTLAVFFGGFGLARLFSAKKNDRKPF